ncbi:MAG TPA: CHAT domain-containing protein [Polyangiaceae bacterium]|nr:CHAT domain-containing protein [Polyangiaceae bacterium]
MLAFVAAATLQCAGRADTCEAASGRDAWPDAARLCAAEYERDPTPERALRLGRASVNVRDGATCERAVGPLVGGPFAGDAHYLLGRVAQQRGRAPEARERFERALALHERGGRLDGVSRDAQALAEVRWREGDYAASLDLLARAADAAGRSGEARLGHYAELARVNVLRTVGDHDAAEAVLRAMLARPLGPRERAWAVYALGRLFVDSERDALAEPLLREALAEATRLGLGEVAGSARLNLGWLARRDGRFAEAEAAFASADDGEDDPVAVALNRGLIAADRGDLERAAGHLADAERAEPEGHHAWWVAYQTGAVAERRGRADEAESAYRRAMAALDQMRDHAGPLAAHVLATYRLPHERLVGLLAGAGRFREALAVVLSFDLSMMLAADAPGRGLSPEGMPTRPAGASQTHLRPRWLDVELGGRGSPGPTALEPVLEAWRGRRLVVLVPGGDRQAPGRARLVRLEVADGEVRGFDAGPLDELERLASRLEADPDDRAAAEALGRAMLPEPPGAGPLDVLAIGPVARAPLGALRRAGRLVVASTPLARVLGLRAWAKPPAAERAGRVVVLGDPLGNLPSAAGEAALAAARLGAAPRLGPEADRGALAAAGGAALLHVASHSVDDGEGAALQLADGALRARAIPALGPTARLVVLASCASGASRDGSGWGSLAAAFLSAGAEIVIATQWSVPDGDSARLVEALYDPELGADARRDAVAALASAQARVAGSISPRAWAAFTAMRAPPTVAGP